MLVLSISTAPSVRQKCHRVFVGFFGPYRKAFLGQKMIGKNYVPFFEIKFFQYTKAFLKAGSKIGHFKSIFKNGLKIPAVSQFLRKKS